MTAGQPPIWSFVEAIVNVLIGLGVAFATQLWLFPRLGWHPTLKTNLIVSGVFTVVSVVRSYFVRRAFNWWHHSRAYRELMAWFASR